MLLSRARDGSDEALGQLLDGYRNYLMLLGRTQISRKLRIRLGASDLVQETLAKAYQHFPDFNGNTEQELTAWLRKILIRQLINAAQQHHGPVRDMRREQSLQTSLERSSLSIHDALADSIATPSEQVSRREQVVLVANAMAELPDDYREVLMGRHIDGQSFAQIAKRMDRSPGAVRMLWLRALEKLNRLLENQQ